MAFAASTGMPVYHQDAADPFLEAAQHGRPYPAHAVTYIDPVYYATGLPLPIVSDIKPRLTKEQHDILESHFQKQNKPNTETKKGFADALQVSLDKVNNWFQNRRAKSKQDAKKAAALNMYTQAAAAAANNNNNFSDGETTPAFSSQDYMSMMQRCGPNEQAYGSLPAYQTHMQGGMFAPSATGMPAGMLQVPATGQYLLDNSQETNRRTLTQEQFNALGHNGIAVQQPGHFDMMSQGFVGGHEAFPQQVCAEMPQYDEKHGVVFAFPSSFTDAPSSIDSSVPSVISEQSMFPPTSDATNLSASPDQWIDTRGAIVSVATSDEGQTQFPQMPPATQQAVLGTSQWQPGQSVPVEMGALQQQFREAQALQQGLPPQPQPMAEQPTAWSDEDTSPRRDSQTSVMLTQQMSEFALQTPQPPSQAQFKPPPPASSIAARRHVKRPAALGIASLRSTSYSGNAGPASPGPGPKSSQQPLRRIQSSVVLNSVAQGRVLKGGMVAAQRSPLNFTFSESINSPKALRHAASSSAVNGSLAPPTPLSPTEMTLGDPTRQQFASPWPSQAHSVRHASISESDVERTGPCFSTAAASPQTFSSPPSTPMFNSQFQPFAGTIGPHMMLHHTPPQSAPASQLSFSPTVFSIPPPPMTAMLPPPPPQVSGVPPQMLGIMAPQQQFMNAAMAEMQFQANPAAFQQPVQSQMVAVGVPQPDAPMHTYYAPDGSVAGVQTQMVLIPASRVTHAQTVAHSSSPPMQAGSTPPSSQSSTAPVHSHYTYLTSAGSSPEIPSAAQAPIQAAPPTELLFHEYSPPEDIKRAATPRKTVDMGPKNYTFANHGPEHFEKDKLKKGSVSSSSPESSVTSQ